MNATITGDIRIIGQNGDGAETIQQAMTLYESLASLGAEPVIEIVIRPGRKVETPPAIVYFTPAKPVQIPPAPTFEVNPNPPTPRLKEAGQPTTEARIQQAWEELNNGARRNLAGFRREVIVPLLIKELERVYSAYGRRYTQGEWDSAKRAWATAGVVLPRSFGKTWPEIQTLLEEGILSATISGTSSGE